VALPGSETPFPPSKTREEEEDEEEDEEEEKKLDDRLCSTSLEETSINSIKAIGSSSNKIPDTNQTEDNSPIEQEWDPVREPREANKEQCKERDNEEEEKRKRESKEERVKEERDKRNVAHGAVDIERRSKKEGKEKEEIEKEEIEKKGKSKLDDDGRGKKKTRK